ncbi:MAG: hypothetical protein IJN46_04535, partial [Lachnospiraceae bacterium]|nr:hypothetical protein [Lachnospiraceae bacterium]
KVSGNIRIIPEYDTSIRKRVLLGLLGGKIMGLFRSLLGGGTNAIEESKYNALLSFVKVGLAFLSGSDGGALVCVVMAIRFNIF